MPWSPVREKTKKYRHFYFSGTPKESRVNVEAFVHAVLFLTAVFALCINMVKMIQAFVNVTKNDAGVFIPECLSQTQSGDTEGMETSLLRKEKGKMSSLL